MITRAISLLIIIGDYDTLKLDPSWQTIIEKCSLKKSMKHGDNIMFPRIKAP